MNIDKLLIKNLVVYQEVKIMSMSISNQVKIRRNYVWLFFWITFISLSLIALSSVQSEAKTGEPIRLAHYTAMTGEESRVGLTLHNAVQLFVDEINNNGGIFADGEYHLIDYNPYDNKFYIPSEELKAAKKSILKDNKKFSIGSYTASCVKATAPFYTKMKHLHLTWGAGYLSPKYPYVLSTHSGAYLNALAMDNYLIQKEGRTRFALIFEDSALGKSYVPWEEIGIRINNLEPVYKQLYPKNTLDFKPILSSILLTKPDVIAIGPSSGGVQARILETARDLGYTGYFTSTEWWLDEIAQRIPLDYINNKAFFPFLDYRCENAPKVAKDFYAKFVDRYGKELWESFTPLGAESLMVLEKGIKKADSIDPTKVMDALIGMKVIDHPIFGPCSWWGKDVFGADYVLLTPSPISKIKDGKVTFVAFSSGIRKMWTENREIAVEVLKKYRLNYQDSE